MSEKAHLQDSYKSHSLKEGFWLEPILPDLMNEKKPVGARDPKNIQASSYVGLYGIYARQHLEFHLKLTGNQYSS